MDERKCLWKEVLGVTMGCTEVNFPKERAKVGEDLCPGEIVLCLV